MEQDDVTVITHVFLKYSIVTGATKSTPNMSLATCQHRCGSMVDRECETRKACFVPTKKGIQPILRNRQQLLLQRIYNVFVSNAEICYILSQDKICSSIAVYHCDCFCYCG